MGSGGSTASGGAVAPGSSASARIPWLGLGSAMAIVGIALGFYNPFIAVTLTSKGFDVAAVGVITAIAAVGFVVAVPLWGQLADTRFGRPQALAIAGLTGGLLLASIQLVASPVLVAPLFLAGSVFVAAWLSLVDAIVVNAVRDSRRYARLRLISSLTYALAALAAGFVYRSTGFGLSLLLVGVGGVVLAVVALRLPDVARAADGHDAVAGDHWWSVAVAPFRPAPPHARAAARAAGDRPRVPRLHGRQHVPRPVPARARRQPRRHRPRVGDLRHDRGAGDLRRRRDRAAVRRPEPVRDRGDVRGDRRGRLGRGARACRSSSRAACSRASGTAGCSSRA